MTAIERLRRVPIFSTLDDHRLERLASIANEFQASTGHVLAERGQAGTGVFIIEEGAARVDLSNGGHVTLGPGDFFGELSVLADTPRNARVSATSDLSGLAISRVDLMELLEREPTIAVAMLKEVARRLADT